MGNEWLRRHGRVIDGYGARRREDDWMRRMEERRAKAEAERLREEKLIKLAAPILTSVAQIKAVATGRPPKSPLYGISKKLSIKDVGLALFGPDGYNRVAVRTNAGNIGPHFDDYEGFAPWTIHRTERGRSGVVRASFLDQKAWEAYKNPRKQDEARLRARDPQHERALRGQEHMDKIDTVYELPLREGTVVLLWQGEDTQKVIPPSVHEVRRFGEGDYTLFASQLSSGFVAHGFVEV